MQKHRKEPAGHDCRTASTVQIRFKIFVGVYSDRLIEVRASVLVSDADDARAPVQPAPRESRLTATAGASPRAAGQVASPPPHCPPEARNPAAPAPPGPHRAGQPAESGRCAPTSPDRRHGWSPR